MNTGNSVDWDVDGTVGARVGRCNNGRLDSDVNDEVGSSGDKEVKDKVGYDN